MPDGKVLIVMALVAVVAVGATKTAHGVKKLGRAVGHSVHHVIKHPVDSVKHGAARK